MTLKVIIKLIKLTIENKTKTKKKPKELIINLKYDDDIEKSQYNMPKKRKQYQ